MNKSNKYFRNLKTASKFRGSYLRNIYMNRMAVITKKYDSRSGIFRRYLLPKD